MSFFEQFAILQASAALHALIRRYANKHFSEEEIAASDLVLDAIADLPRRIHDEQTSVAKNPAKPAQGKVPGL